MSLLLKAAWSVVLFSETMPAGKRILFAVFQNLTEYQLKFSAWNNKSGLFLRDESRVQFLLNLTHEHSWIY